ncbi:MAG: hypothetical protein EGR16_06520 [Clostridiales bacterium]|nr:hypothetical protein [Clostridiales bacterium]
METINNTSNKKVYLIKEEVKNLENKNQSALSGLENELLKYSREFCDTVEVISLDTRNTLSESIKKLI